MCDGYISKCLYRNRTRAVLCAVFIGKRFDVWLIWWLSPCCSTPEPVPRGATMDPMGKCTVEVKVNGLWSFMEVVIWYQCCFELCSCAVVRQNKHYLGVETCILSCISNKKVISLSTCAWRCTECVTHLTWFWIPPGQFYHICHDISRLCKALLLFVAWLVGNNESFRLTYATIAPSLSENALVYYCK